MLFNLIDNFCAIPLHNDVLPVPGGPWSNIMRFIEIISLLIFNLEK